MSDGALDSSAREHAWQYFALHANQRMSVFNFFAVLAGLLVAAIGAAFKPLPWASVGLGLLLALVAVVFAKLDSRVSFLIKHSEKALIAMERSFPEEAQLFTTEPTLTESKGRSLWSYSRSFRVLFWSAGIGGCLSTLAALARATGVLPAG